MVCGGGELRGDRGQWPVAVRTEREECDSYKSIKEGIDGKA